ncbi:hypothetical protein QBC40DRAFT_294242 [Triangularia verruculosa]|uniref:Uncharacterized protein n=1 Tax=Triangularia verruculosa TaxID=2587418 RepID=A0AAN7AY00_9PEZI|nr:hypothetical protein QBC40DRAFT_294242 [Triangularia verruculosa]
MLRESLVPAWRCVEEARQGKAAAAAAAACYCYVMVTTLLVAVMKGVDEDFLGAIKVVRLAKMSLIRHASAAVMAPRRELPVFDPGSVQHLLCHRTAVEAASVQQQCRAFMRAPLTGALRLAAPGLAPLCHRTRIEAEQQHAGSSPVVSPLQYYFDKSQIFLPSSSRPLCDDKEGAGRALLLQQQQQPSSAVQPSP